MDLERQAKLLEMMFERANALNGYWNIYIVVGLGFLGLLASGKDFSAKRHIKVILSLAFAAFAVVNLEAMDSTNEARRHLLSILNGSALERAAYAARPSERWQLWSFHLAIDLLVLLAIWLIPWVELKQRQRKGS